MHHEEHAKESISHANHTESIQSLVRITDCNRTQIFGSLVQSTAPFLFPCTIEFSLICALILFEMWKKVKSVPDIERTRRDSQRYVEEKPKSQLSVDCSHSHRGVLGGIIVTVITIISLLMYFVLDDFAEYERLAIQEVSLCELFFYAISLTAVIFAIIRMRDLKYCRKIVEKHHEEKVKLDCALLVVAQFGLFIYAIFSLFGCYFMIQDHVDGGWIAFATELMGEFLLCLISKRLGA